MSTLQADVATGHAINRPADDPEMSDREPMRGVSRRALFGGAAFASLWGSARHAIARPDPPTVSADVDPAALLAKLVGRITFGYTEAEYALASSMGYDAYLDYHLNAASIPEDPALDTRLAALTTLTMNYTQLVALNNTGQISNELTEAVIVRAWLSKRQLFERMVELWTDHFNIDINNGEDALLKPLDDRETIRANALTTFPQLLYASAHSPAMLYYLNNDISVVGNPNENYARELMELHSVGVDGGYTQTDVVNVAKCFTGWTWWGRSAGALAGTFRYNNAVHDQTQKTVLGNIIPANGGMQDALTVLNILSNHPSTARFIATKICRKFIGEDAPQAVIDDVASTYTRTGGDIKAMVRAALKPNVLADATPRYKRPFHVFMSAMRALPTTLTATSSLRSQLTGAGHRPFFWNPPDGYPDTLSYWSGLILPRWNFGASLLQNQLSGITVDYSGFFSGLTTADAMIDKINRVMFGGAMPANERTAIRNYMQPDPPSATRQREGIGLAIGAPSFQWY